MFGRRHVKTRRDLVRAEFGASMDLLKQAAAHAAGGLGATVGPSIGNVKDSAMNKTDSARGFMKPAAGRVTTAASQGWDSTIAAFSPLADAAKQGSIRAGMLDAKRKPKKDEKAPKVIAFSSTTTETETPSHTGLYALLATGVAVGAAGALVARRRTRAKWAEYEPGSLRSDASSFMDAGATSTKSFGDKTSDRTADLTDDAGAVTKATTWTKGHAKSAVETVRNRIHEATAPPDDSMDDKADKAVDKASDKVNEGAAHMTDKAEAKYNATSHSGGSSTNTRGGARVDDEVDDLIRSAKNGRM